MLTQAITTVLRRNMSKRFSINKIYKTTASRYLWMKLATMLLLLTSSMRAQSALDGFDPNANGPVRVVIVQPDGKILLGGEFTTLSPNGGTAVTRNHIARLNPDGTLDAAFNPNANAPVYAIALQADGKILVGGSFGGPNGIGGQPRSLVARLDATTGLADSFDPNGAPGFVTSIAVQADDKILVSGLFNSMGGQPRSNIARLDPTTGLADSFDPNANGLVRSIVVQLDGKILACGWFNGPNSIGGQTRNRIARLDAMTGLADSFDPNANDIVYEIALQADGKILVGGFFNGANSIGGQTRNNIARLDPNSGLADSFNPNANAGIYEIAVQADGKILVGGLFNGANSIGGQTRNRIARLDATTGLADAFDPNANDAVESMAVQADGKIVVAGYFSGANSIGGQPRNRIARLEIDGRLDQTLNLSIVGNYVVATAVQPDGKILIGGAFGAVLGVTRSNIARLNTDGTLDTIFNPNANDQVYSIAVQADGRILVGGYFTSIGWQMRNRIARLDATTGLADSFNPDANDDVYSIAVQPDGKILVGGAFTSIGGQGRNYIARLDPTIGLADSLNPNANNTVYAIAVQADSRILTGGFFTSVGGQTRNRIAGLDAATGLADPFDPNANDFVSSIVVQPEGKILVGGYFNGTNSIAGQTRNYIARLDATGLADSFNPNASGLVESMALQADGKIVTGGYLRSIGGQTRNGLARLDPATGLADSFNPNSSFAIFSVAVQADGKILAGGLGGPIGGQTRFGCARLTNDTAALQNLAVTESNISWMRGGSSPQFARVTFEYSTDNVNYTPLGNGTASGSNWTLTGLNFGGGQNFFIRARGYFRSGYLNGSESIVESVRNAFLAEPTSSPTPTPTPLPTVTISGTVSYCSNSVPGSVPNVTLNLTGSASTSTLSDSSGNYIFSGVPSGGNYTVTPSKAALPPGSVGISTVDVIGIQRHFLGLGTPLSGCRLTAADVNGLNGVDTVDVIAVQRFFLGLSTGLADVGKYKFNPVTRTYTGLVTNQTGQNYDTLVFGDVTNPFVH